MLKWFIIWGICSFVLGTIFGVVTAYGWPELWKWAFPRDEEDEKPEIIMTTCDHEN